MRAWRLPPFGVEVIALLVCVYFTLASNRMVWQRVFADLSWGEGRTWLYAACLGVAVTALQFAFVVPLLARRTVRPLLALLIVATAFATYLMQKYTVFLDPAMVRNALHTETREAAELFSWDLLPHLVLQAVLPVAVLWVLPVADHSWRRAVLQRIGAIAAALIVFALALLIVFQDAAALARNHRELRHLVTPGNFLYALAKLGHGQAETVAKPLAPIARDVALGPSWAERSKPALLVIVVGETARAASWGLNGYRRQTTPQLAQLDVVNFPDARACGTDTEISLPCMFSPWGRRDYDETRSRTHESLLHVLDRARLRVLWRDNQSGCKGVCKGLEVQPMSASRLPTLCDGGRCFDEVLLYGLDAQLRVTHASQVVVLHQLGSHGPAYFSRYPNAFRRYSPTCETGELRKCTREQIVNAYDNSVLYTDHMLAQTIRFLQSQQGTHDTALLYVSDHGESLGERNLYLHGMPWAVAPSEQTQVPMLMWLSPGFAASFGVNVGCLRERSSLPTGHDHLFHTVLGMLDLHTSAYEGAFDLTKPCRAPSQMHPQRPLSLRIAPAGEGRDS